LIRNAATGIIQNMPAGRPTLYRPEYCQLAIDLLSQGYSLAKIAAELRVSRQTIYQWRDDNPEFSDALKAGEAASAAWWQEQLRRIVSGGEGNAAAAIFGLKNRDPNYWREKRELDHTSSDRSMSPANPTLALIEAIKAPQSDNDA
jgi:hypothetical protein